jgi:hypothetical protein
MLGLVATDHPATPSDQICQMLTECLLQALYLFKYMHFGGPSLSDYHLLGCAF